MMYRQGYYTGRSEDEIAMQLSSEGFRPRRVAEPAGSRYERHQNPQDIVLAFVEGAAEIRVGDSVFQCGAGDRLHITGDIPHSAVVGPEGCVYFMNILPPPTD